MFATLSMKYYKIVRKKQILD